MTAQGAKFRSGIALVSLCLGLCMVVIDATIVNVSIPTIGKALQGSLGGLQWVIDGYILTYASLLLTTGSLSDQINAKKLFFAGLVLFVVTSFFCGLASSIEMLIVFRLFQGIGAALIMPTSLSLVNALYDDKAKRARAIGVWGGLGGIAAASGPLLGGILTHLISWRAIFYVNVPLGFIAIWLCWRYAPSPKPSGKIFQLDLIGQVTAIIAIAALAFLFIEAGEMGWASMHVTIAATIFVLALVGFLVNEQRSNHPMLPLKLFRFPAFSSSIVIGLFLNFGLYGQLFLLPLYFQQIRHYPTLLTAFAILPVPALSSIASYLGGKVSSKIGTKLPVMVGLCVGATGFLSLLIIGDTKPSYGVLILPLMMLGFGMAFSMPAITITTINSVPKELGGLASGSINTSRQLGSLLGVAALGSIVGTASDFVIGLHVALIVSATLFLLGALLCMRFIKNSQ